MTIIGTAKIERDGRHGASHLVPRNPHAELRQRLSLFARSTGAPENLRVHLPANMKAVTDGREIRFHRTK